MWKAAFWISFMVWANVAFAKADDDLELTTDWNLTVTENGVERTMQAVDPSPNTRFPFVVDQHLAPGWTCEVLPLIWHGTSRSRWLTCQNGGRAKVSIRTSCRSDRAGSRVQEMWLGDQVSIELACRSGISP
jgi:hypothetical protein